MFHAIGLRFHCFTMLLKLWTWLVIEDGCGYCYLYPYTYNTRKSGPTVSHRWHLFALHTWIPYFWSLVPPQPSSITSHVHRFSNIVKQWKRSLIEWNFIVISVLPKGRSFTANSVTKAAILLKGRSSIANSGTKVAVLLGMNRCGSFPLLSTPHSLFNIWTNLKRSQGH